MNLGNRRVKNEELRVVFQALNLADVGTFRASGNVAFTAAAEPPDRLGARIEAGLRAALGYEVPTFLREARELRAIAAHEPFDPALTASFGGKLQVGLLQAPPAKRAREAVLALAGERDRLAFGERELYWLPSGGLLDSQLDLRTIDELLGPSTRRTKGTIEQMAAKHFPA